LHQNTRASFPAALIDLALSLKSKSITNAVAYRHLQQSIAVSLSVATHFRFFLDANSFFLEIASQQSSTRVWSLFGGIMLLQEATYSEFQPCLGNKFKLHLSPEAILDAELIAVEKSNQRALAREPFSLLFRTLDLSGASQSTYKLEHPKLGELHIFLVPIGPDSQGMRWEAVFN
jgi:hypothetical protein